MLEILFLQFFLQFCWCSFSVTWVCPWRKIPHMRLLRELTPKRWERCCSEELLLKLALLKFIVDICCRNTKRCSGKNLLTSVLDFGNPLTRCLTAVILSTWQNATLIWWCLTAITLISRMYALIWWCFSSNWYSGRTDTADRPRRWSHLLHIFSLIYHVLWNTSLYKFWLLWTWGQFHFEHPCCWCKLCRDYN